MAANLKALRGRVRAVRDQMRGLPPAATREFVGDGDFERIGRDFVRYFVDLGGLRPTDRVLDIGCGIGRMAIPLAGFLAAPGTYEGFDIGAIGIDWCNRNIARRNPRFKFTHVDLYNSFYNPRGTLDPGTFRFPYSDEGFDFGFATSVFTHLMPSTATHYLQELTRVLRVGGRGVLTVFLLDEQSRDGIRSGTSSQAFVHGIGAAAMSTNVEKPEAAIAYDEEWLRASLGSCGLEIVEPIRWGSWSGRADYLSYQDLLVVRKR